MDYNEHFFCVRHISYFDVYSSWHSERIHVIHKIIKHSKVKTIGKISLFQKDITTQWAARKIKTESKEYQVEWNLNSYVSMKLEWNKSAEFLRRRMKLNAWVSSLTNSHRSCWTHNTVHLFLRKKLISLIFETHKAISLIKSGDFVNDNSRSFRGMISGCEHL